MGEYIPGYLKLHDSGELERRAGMLGEMLDNCTVCPHQCKVNRIDNTRGFCRDAFPELSRRITGAEYARAVQIAEDLGLKRIIAFHEYIF